jgi:hypothetical protein
LRLYLYLSAGSEFCSNDPFGLAVLYFYGLGDTGENNSGYLVHRATKQKEWIELTISGTNLAKLATQTDDGLQFKGLQMGIRAYSNNNNNLYTTTPTELNGFIILDHITYEVDEAVVKQKEAIAHKNEVTKNGTTLLASADQTATQVVDGKITKVSNNAVSSSPRKAETMSSVAFEGGANSTVWKKTLHSAAAVALPSIKFSKPVKVEDIESINIRLYAHLSAGSAYCTTGASGVFVVGLEEDAVVKGENSHMIPKTVQQDVWIDYSIEGNQLNYLVDSDGNINGIQISSYIYNDTGSDDIFYVGAEGSGVSWILID